MTACGPSADERSKNTHDLADQAFTNTLRLADEVEALRKRVNELERSEEELRKQNVEDAENIADVAGTSARVEGQHR